jgi:uncharacterized protein
MFIRIPVILRNVKITVFVKPNSKKESVDQSADGSYVVRVNAPPVEGAANERVVELLSKLFKKPKSSFELISGHRSKRKIFKILG